MGERGWAERRAVAVAVVDEKWGGMMSGRGRRNGYVSMDGWMAGR